MSIQNNQIDSDTSQMEQWLSQIPDTEKVKNFVSGPGISRLELKFDIKKLRAALEIITESTEYVGEDVKKGHGAIPLTRRPGTSQFSDNDISGRYWLRKDEKYIEEQVEEVVDETVFSELVPDFIGTYFEQVHKELTARFTIGRMRILSKAQHCCNHWHRDPEPRLHIPIVSNPGSLFIVNNHCTHLPADGSVYFTDTRGYHAAVNGGFYDRVHIVATLPM